MMSILKAQVLIFVLSKPKISLCFSVNLFFLLQTLKFNSTKIWICAFKIVFTVFLTADNGKLNNKL